MLVSRYQRAGPFAAANRCASAQQRYKSFFKTSRWLLAETGRRWMPDRTCKPFFFSFLHRYHAPRIRLMLEAVMMHEKSATDVQAAMGVGLGIWYSRTRCFSVATLNPNWETKKKNDIRCDAKSEISKHEIWFCVNNSRYKLLWFVGLV